MEVTRKKLIEILDIEGMRNLKDITTDVIHVSKADIKEFKGELQEAFMMTLEKYSPKSQKIYEFLFKS